jgi:DNA polymerase-3 subunit beta
MKFKIKKKLILENLNYAIKGISNKNLIPILNCFKFELNEEGLYIISTDNEIAIKTFIPEKDIIEVIEQGEMVIAGKFLYEIVRKLDNDIITFEEIIDNQLLITTSNSSFKLNCNEVSDFPNIDLEFTQNPIIISNKVFKNTINQTIFAVSNQESRPVLTGINFKIEDKDFESTATDSYRLSRKKFKIEKQIDEKIDLVIPSKNLLEIVKMVKDDNNHLELHTFPNKVIFKIDNIIVMSRLINGNYPDTDKLIPETFDLKIKVNLNQLYNAIDRASLLTSEDEKNIIQFETKDNQAIITSNIPEIGNVEEKISIEKQDQKEIKISFSSKFMLEAIKTFESEDVLLCFNGEIKPIIITNVEHNDLIQLILPIRTF